MVSGLTIIIDKFKSGSVAGHIPLIGWMISPPTASLTIRIENTTKGFLTYTPAGLVIARNDGNQVLLAKQRIEGNWRPVEGTNLAPGTHLEVAYYLSDRVTLPAKIYYEQKLLAEITE